MTCEGVNDEADDHGNHRDEDPVREPLVLHATVDGNGCLMALKNQRLKKKKKKKKKKKILKKKKKKKKKKKTLTSCSLWVKPTVTVTVTTDKPQIRQS